MSNGRNFLLTAILLVLALPCGAEDGATAFPAFDVATGDGSLKPVSEFFGAVTIVNFWATWCGPCRIELPRLASLSRDLADKGLSVVPVNIEGSGALARAFLSANNLDLPVYVLESRRAAALGIATLPFTVLLDGDGRVVQVYPGFSESGMAALLSRTRALLRSAAGE